MAGLYHGDLSELLGHLNRQMLAAGLLETFDFRWPSSACTEDVNSGLRARVVKNDRPTELKLPLGQFDVPSSTTLTFTDFASSGVDGYWSSRVTPTGRKLGDDGEEYRPLLSHVVAGSRDEGYSDRELKRITMFRSVPPETGVQYLCEAFLKALDWRGGAGVGVSPARGDVVRLAKNLADKTKVSQRFVSIMVADLWTFPTVCVREIENWVLALNIGQQHFDVPEVMTRHTRHGKCACKKNQAVAGSRSYLIFGSDKVLSHIARVLGVRSGSASESARRHSQRASVEMV